jgi:hypothetical protein
MLSAAEKERLAIIRAATDLISTVADPTQAWDIALSDFEYAMEQVYNGNLT